MQPERLAHEAIHAKSFPLSFLQREHILSVRSKEAKTLTRISRFEDISSEKKQREQNLSQTSSSHPLFLTRVNDVSMTAFPF
jgi:hypothetical protein